MVVDNGAEPTVAKLQFKLLGGFEARIDTGPPVLSLPRKAQALLAYLVMSQGRPRSRSHLANLLWGSHGDDQARNSLRQTLFVIRRDLVDLTGLVARGDQVWLDAGTYRADALDLEDLTNGASAAIPEGAHRLIAGTFMDGLNIREPAFQEWLEEERRNCRRLAQTVLQGRLAHLEEDGIIITPVTPGNVITRY